MNSYNAKYECNQPVFANMGIIKAYLSEPGLTVALSIEPVGTYFCLPSVNVNNVYITDVF